MITRPTTHGCSVTVGELRAFFLDDHVHAALLVDADRLIGVVERADLTGRRDEAPARRVASLHGRTITPDARAGEALRRMTRTGSRRLAVVGDDGELLGLLCLKSSGRGFCSDAGVRDRRRRKAPAT